MAQTLSGKTVADEPGYSRDEDLERARPRDRPAEANMDADPEAAAKDPLTVSPDPDAAGDR